MAMALTRTEADVEATLVRFLRTVPIRKRLWARAEHGLITFWLETEPLSDEDEEALFAANRLIYAAVPEARFDFIVLNPAIFDEDDCRFTPPPGAEEIVFD